MEWNTLSSEAIKTKLKQLELDHEGVKHNILKLCDEMDQISDNYLKGIKELEKRK